MAKVLTELQRRGPSKTNHGLRAAAVAAGEAAVGGAAAVYKAALGARESGRSSEGGGEEEGEEVDPMYCFETGEGGEEKAAANVAWFLWGGVGWGACSGTQQGCGAAQRPARWEAQRC